VEKGVLESVSSPANFVDGKSQGNQFEKDES
jgi:hypothetical protein